LRICSEKFNEMKNQNLTEELRIYYDESIRLEDFLPVYSKINIFQGATLTITGNKTNVLLLYVTGDFILNGKIVFREFEKSSVHRELIVDDVRYGFQFANNKLGGAGGMGGKYDGSGASNIPGNGAMGTIKSGGGGGSGVYAPNRNGLKKGKSAIDYKGATGWLSVGGDGGINREFLNGGLMFIRVGGDFILGPQSLIDVSGSQGQEGNPGSDGKTDIDGQWYKHCCPAGGGGGGPGGDGGIIIHKVNGSLIGTFNILLQGGPGGSRGPKGKHFIFTPDCLAEDGLEGDFGNFGKLIPADDLT
jgi:hypothetical protein